jgi:acyl-coenzyme A synthetase/AMP-(fatty) acid ligase
MFIDFLIERFSAWGTEEAIIWHDHTYSFDWLAREIESAIDHLRQAQVEGAVVSLETDFSPRSIAWLLALVERRCIIVPLTSSVEGRKPVFREVAQVETRIEIDDSDEPRLNPTGIGAEHPILKSLQERGHPGLVLFSSGSTGESKAAVHDFDPMLAKFRTQRPALRALSFLLFDHIGGVNTLLHTLSNGGCIITVQDRSPDTICSAIERHRVELLPTSPTFLNILLLSEADRRHDLSSLRVITYGTEIMPAGTLRRLRERIGGPRLQQTYGLSEVGILRSKSRSSDSLWVKVGGEGFETRVVDRLLEIKARSAMLGYLNAPSPFTDDGWFQTGDEVEVDGDWIRILGRRSEIVNVGGEKVWPGEVEDVLQEMEGVEDVAVSSEPNPLTGQIVVASVKLSRPESTAEFRKRMRSFCRGRLERFKIPQKVVLAKSGFHGGRFKKLRRGTV